MVARRRRSSMPQVRSAGRCGWVRTVPQRGMTAAASWSIRFSCRTFLSWGWRRHGCLQGAGPPHRHLRVAVPARWRGEGERPPSTIHDRVDRGHRVTHGRLPAYGPTDRARGRKAWVGDRLAETADLAGRCQPSLREQRWKWLQSVVFGPSTAAQPGACSVSPYMLQFSLEPTGHRSQRDRSGPRRGGDPKRVARGLLEAECFRSARKHSTRRWSSRRRTWTMPVANRRSSTGRALKASRQRRPGADGRAQGTAGPSIEHHRWWRQKVGRPDVDSGHGVIRRPSRPSVSRHHTARAIARRMASAQPGGFGLMGCTARGGRPARLARLPGADQSQHRRSLETPGAPLRPVAAWAVRVRSAAIPAPARPIGSSCRRRRSSPGRPAR